ncbi:MAG: hypothetical protein QM733_04525 [Ilumatobacteraceae bacterium]
MNAGVHYDWVFRHAGDSLLESPDLQIAPPPQHCVTRAWVATLWRDPTAAGRWVSGCWEPVERGWRMPWHLVVGDVVEFGLAAINPYDGLAVRGWDQRWYGWLRYATDVALVIAGPYHDADACAADAANAVAEMRLAQLTGPDADPAWGLDASADVGAES